jgi:putative PIN family toxin of toxin-antitoxin system
VGKKTKVVIDTNVIVSAFGWHGTPEKIIKLVVTGKIHNFITIEILAEVARVVSYPKLKFPKSLQAEIIETIFIFSKIVEPEETVNIIKDDPEDNKILECAVSAEAEFIITGDSHLLNLKNFRGIEILAPDEFLMKKIV